MSERVSSLARRHELEHRLGNAVLRWDPDFDPNLGDAVQFRLTYEGELLSTQKDPVGGQADARAEHKRDMRRQFHLQLKRLWEVNPYLKHGYPVRFDWKSNSNPKEAISYHASLAEFLAPLYKRNAYNCVPLVREELGLICHLDVLYMRPGSPGSVISATGDIDNRLKTLFDALRLPKGTGELVGYDAPSADENPFFVLLEDDGLITHVSVETDELLQPVNGKYDPNIARLVITVRLRPYNINPSNQSFG